MVKFLIKCSMLGIFLYCSVFSPKIGCMSSRFSINTPMDAPINFDYSRQRRNSSSLSIYYRRIINKQLDFEMAIWSMIYLVLSPSKVYKYNLDFKFYMNIDLEMLIIKSKQKHSGLGMIQLFTSCWPLA